MSCASRFPVRVIRGIMVISQLYSLLHVSTSMASTGYGPSGASAATEKFMFFCGKPGTFADFKFRFGIFIKAQGHVDVIHMKITDYRAHVSSHATRSKESEERARKGLVESLGHSVAACPTSVQGGAR